MSERPPLPKLKRGDAVIVVTRGKRVRHIVTGIGPTWLRVVPEGQYGDHLREKSYERRFLLADQQEGLPAQRFGIPAIFATPEQHAYDVETKAAMDTLFGAGLLISAGPGPFRDRDNMVNLANVVREMWPDA